MFGALLGLFGIGVASGSRIKHGNLNHNRKQQAINSNSKIYMDYNGCLRNVRNNHRVYHTTDKNGYRIYVDAKTKEVLDNEQETILKRKMQIEKERAIRAGRKVYSYLDVTKNEYGIPITTTVYRLVKNDKRVIDGFGGYLTPKFELRLELNGTSYQIIDNRKRVYKYCRDWYINRTGYSPIFIKEEANEYGVFIYDKDVDYCMQKIKESNGGECLLDSFALDDEYRMAEWVNPKHRY